ncbi:MAG TPA: response regulator [Urbifossiella sp.]|jgi:CheY-like chemotaxis protein|nr:response regulator [Urbifossiella sp.]
MLGTQLSVLVVDDDHDTADSLTDLLHLTGYHARAAYGGIEAQRLATEEWPDVVILDLAMPDIDGWELAHRLHPRPPAPRPLLIAVTGYEGKDEQRRAREAGIDLYLVKPVHLDVIEPVLHRFHRVISPHAVG